MKESEIIEEILSFQKQVEMIRKKYNEGKLDDEAFILLNATIHIHFWQVVKPKNLIK